MKRILLIGHYGFGNRGCEAIVRGTVTIIRRHIPDAQITLITQQPELDAAVSSAAGIPVDRFVLAHFPYKRFTPLWVLKVIDHRLLHPRLSHFNYLHRTLYKEQDAVLSIGGDNFTDDYGTPWDHFERVRYAKDMGAMTIIWAASIGPFQDRAKAQRWTEIMNEMDLITVRESVTREYLRALGISERVRLVADPAFLVEPSPPRVPPKSKAKDAILVGIGISDLLTQSSDYGEHYVHESAKFILHLINDLKVQVRLISHVAGGKPYCNDFAACQRVKNLAGLNDGVEVVDPRYDAAEMKSIIGECDYFIGARTHSTIASLSMLVPTLSVAYSVKAFGINRELFGSDDYVLPVERLSLQALNAKFRKMMEDDKGIVQTLRRRIPEMKALALKGGEYLAELLS